ncbi:hypothetical protein NPIL_248021 [Nephila pilipes]|uniref:Uncharacterized protein n=1 Tax=Nephila pilipes TaxID=299642 RepID=A0A8X6N6M9_NEPPI|nr:hypothetical protein NPIL_248021 [Nephila pilipes]
MNAISPGNNKKENSTENKEECIKRCNFDDTQSAATDCNGKNDSKGCQKTESEMNSKRSKGKKNKRRSGGKRHRGSRFRKNCKPYYGLTRDEKEKIDKRNLRQTRRRRVKMRKSGMPLAPLNTTQFIVNDKKCVDNYYDESSHSDSEYAPDFNKMWLDVLFERFQELSVEDLVSRYISTEDEIENMQIEKGKKHFEQSTKIEIFREEIRNLKEKNDELIRVNDELYKLLESRGYLFEESKSDGNQQLQNVLSLNS